MMEVQLEPVKQNLSANLQLAITKLQRRKIKEYIKESKQAGTFISTEFALVFYAAQNKNSIALRFLHSLKNSQKIDIVGSSSYEGKYTSLAAAAMAGSLPCVKYLLKMGSKLDQEDDYHPLLCAARQSIPEKRVFFVRIRRENEQMKICHYLLNKHINSIPHDVLYKYYLIMCGKDVRANTSLLKNINKVAELYLSLVYVKICQYGSVDSIKEFEFQYYHRINFSSYNGDINPVKAAASDDHLTQFEYLLEKYIKEKAVNQADSHGDNLLTYLVECNMPACISTFLKVIENSKIYYTKDYRDKISSALHLAIASSKKEVVLAFDGHVTKRDIIPKTFHESFTTNIQQNNLQAINFLLDCGVNVSKAPGNLIPPMVLACRLERLSIVKCFVKNGVSYNSSDNGYPTPFKEAKDCKGRKLKNWFIIHSGLILPIRCCDVKKIRTFLENNRNTLDTDIFQNYTDERDVTIKDIASNTKNTTVIQLVYKFILLPYVEKSKKLPHVFKLVEIPNDISLLEVHFLTKLDLSLQKLGDEKVNSLSLSLGKIPSNYLNTLKLRGNNLTNSCLKRIVDLLNNKQSIVVLDLSENALQVSTEFYVEQIQSLIVAIKHNTKFLSLSLAENRLIYSSQKGLKETMLEPLSNHLALEKLDLSGNYISKVDFKELKLLYPFIISLASKFFSTLHALSKNNGKEESKIDINRFAVAITVLNYHVACMFEGVDQYGQKFLHMGELEANKHKIEINKYGHVAYKAGIKDISEKFEKLEKKSIKSYATLADSKVVSKVMDSLNSDFENTKPIRFNRLSIGKNSNNCATFISQLLVDYGIFSKDEIRIHWFPYFVLKN